MRGRLSRISPKRRWPGRKSGRAKDKEQGSRRFEHALGDGAWGKYRVDARDAIASDGLRDERGKDDQVILMLVHRDGLSIGGDAHDRLAAEGKVLPDTGAGDFNLHAMPACDEGLSAMEHFCYHGDFMGHDAASFEDGWNAGAAAHPVGNCLASEPFKLVGIGTLLAYCTNFP
jgi:hypothetical protein